MATAIKKCPECGGVQLTHNKDKGEIICRSCGLVIEDKMIDFGQEWREFDSEDSDKRRRTGAPMTYTKYDRGLGTDVGQKQDIYRLSGKGKNKYFRLRKWQYRISTAIERNLKLALDELAEASGIDKKEIGRTYRFVTRELGIRILPSNPIDYIPRFASALRLSADTQSKAVEILEMAQNSELTSGRGPTGIAAASLYVAALINNEKRTQREVADIAGVTEVTIRNRYKELLRELDLKGEIKKKDLEE